MYVVQVAVARFFKQSRVALDNFGRLSKQELEVAIHFLDQSTLDAQALRCSELVGQNVKDFEQPAYCDGMLRLLHIFNEFDCLPVELNLFLLELVFLYVTFFELPEVDEIDGVHEVRVNELTYAWLLWEIVVFPYVFRIFDEFSHCLNDDVCVNLQRKDDLNHFLTKLVLLAGFSSIAMIYLHFGIPDPQKAFYESFWLLQSEVFQNLDDFLLNFVEVLL